MPTNPVSPNTHAAIDRLTLGIDAPRGSAPSTAGVFGPYTCFDAEASGVTSPGSMWSCFSAE